jgi:cell division protein FtsB
MTHPDPEHLERHLLDARVMGQGSDSVPLRYFIPYLVLARQKVTTAGRDTYTAGGQTADREKANNEIRRQDRQIERYEMEIKEMDRQIEGLTDNRDSLEKFARENFGFKEPGDDVYVLEK